MTDDAFDGPTREKSTPDDSIPAKVVPSKRGCRLNLPPMPGGGSQTITREEYLAWTND